MDMAMATAMATCRAPAATVYLCQLAAAAAAGLPFQRGGRCQQQAAARRIPSLFLLFLRMSGGPVHLPRAVLYLAAATALCLALRVEGQYQCLALRPL